VTRIAAKASIEAVRYRTLSERWRITLGGCATWSAQRKARRGPNSESRCQHRGVDGRFAAVVANQLAVAPGSVYAVFGSGQQASVTERPVALTPEAMRVRHALSGLRGCAQDSRCPGLCGVAAVQASAIALREWRRRRPIRDAEPRRHPTNAGFPRGFRERTDVMAEAAPS
jgi:hypothetical protein